jgi:hypothetical protein
MKCDAMIVLPDWNLSKGACIEVDVAEKIGIPVCLGVSDLKMELDFLKKK